jgi:hypothetical protein
LSILVSSLQIRLQFFTVTNWTSVFNILIQGTFVALSLTCQLVQRSVS